MAFLLGYHDGMAIRGYFWALLFLFPTSLLRGETVYQGLPDGPTLIKEDRRGRVYVAVLGEHGTVVRNDERGTDIWKQGNVGGLDITPEGDLWLVYDNRILRYAGDVDHDGQPVDRTPSFQPRPKPGRLFASRWNDLWASNCGAMRRPDAMFAPSTLGQVAGWDLKPSCDDPFGNVWAIATTVRGTRQDLAVRRHDTPDRWQLVGLPEARTAGGYLGPCTDDAGFIWLATEKALLRVDPRTEGPGKRVIASPVADHITAIVRVAGRQIAVGFSDGSVRELTLEAGAQPRWRFITKLDSGPIHSMLHDGRGTFWLVSGRSLHRIGSLRADWHKHWEEQPRLPAGNHDIIFARLGDKLYTAGGKTFFGLPASQWVNLDHIWSYDVNRGTWHVEAPMLEPGKAYSGIAALGGELWLIGGYFREGKGTKATRTVEIFDPRTGRFRLGPALGQPRGQMVALTVTDRLFAIGGEGDGEASNEMFSIAVGETEWQRERPAPGPIIQASGCVVSGKIYIAAGAASKCPGLFVYDPQRRAWDSVSHPSGTVPSAALCAALKGRVWVAGGRGADRGLLATYAYSPLTRQWSQGPDLPLPVSWGAASEVDGQLLIAGGAYRDASVGDYFNSDRVFLLRWP